MAYIENINTSTRSRDAILPMLKKYVENSHCAYSDNYKRFNFFRKFVYQTSISTKESDILNALNKPVIEFNITEAPISRLVGEFSKQEPSIEVSAENGTQVDAETLNLVEQHIRHIMFKGNENGADYEVYKDQLSGGFSAYKVYTKYAHEMSFNQIIGVDRVFDPTLCGWDTLARNPTKSDGRYCFELYPKSRSEVEDEYPDFDVSKLNFSRNIEGFSWNYRSDANEDIVMLCDFYLKKVKKIKIVMTVEGKVMEEKDYKDLLEQWSAHGLIPQPPAIVGKPRSSTKTIVCRYVFSNDYLIDYEETSFKYLPIVYVPGNDIMIRDSDSGTSTMLTRPYVYHMVGAQRLKNFAGQTWANEIENMVTHKWMAPKQAIPQQEDYQKAWKNPQQASVFIYEAFNNNNPDQPIPPPREIQRTPMPREISEAFQVVDGLMQTILGSYDASLGINDNQLSGTAIVEGATQSNAAAMPYIVSNLMAKQQLANIFVDLLPKYYKFPMTIPVLGKDGTSSDAQINGEGQPKFNYDENTLKVKVEAGVNFQIQKNRALNQIISLMSASPLFGQFINTEGLPILLDNLEIRGVDQLKDMCGKWMQEMKQQQEEAKKNNPDMIKAQIEQQKMQQKAQDSQSKNQIDIAKIEQDEQKVMADLEVSRNSNQVQLIKAETERFVKKLEHKSKLLDMAHTHAKDISAHHHKVDVDIRGLTNNKDE